MLRIRSILMVLAFLAPVMFAVHCPAAGAPVRIGATVSLGGKYSEPSASIRDGFKLWEKQVNERGGLLGRPVELVLYDDDSCPGKVRELYTRLIVEDKVDLVFSPYGTPLTMAAAEVTTRYGYTMLACGAAGEDLFESGFRNVFGMYCPAGRYFIGLLDIMARNGLNTVAIVYENSPFSRVVAKGAKEWAERFGLKVSSYRSYNSGMDEFGAILKEIREENPDGLILASYPEDSYLMLNMMKAEKYKPRVLGFTIAPAYPDFYRNAGVIAEGVFGVSQWEPDERMPFPGTKKFIADYLDFMKKLPSYHSGSAYASCQIVEKAVQNCRCFDQAAIADFIRSLDTVTIIGRFKVGQGGKQTGHNAIIIQWQNGKKEIVFPFNMQTAAPRL